MTETTPKAAPGHAAQADELRAIAARSGEVFETLQALERDIGFPLSLRGAEIGYVDALGYWQGLIDFPA